MHKPGHKPGHEPGRKSGHEPGFSAGISALAAAAFSAVLWAAAAGTSPAQAQQSPGSKYGTREPRTCASKKEPTSGPPSASQAAQILSCSLEQEYGRQLYLLGDINVEVGKGTPYMELSRSARPFDGDVDGLVYSIRGSYKQYQCNQVTDPARNGKQCTRRDHVRASGTCYRTNFGDWYCNMSDSSVIDGVSDQPPPR